jgi:hypothetical protein
MKEYFKKMRRRSLWKMNLAWLQMTHMKVERFKEADKVPINATMFTLGIYTDVLCYKINILKFLRLTNYSPKYILRKIFFLWSLNQRVFEYRG